MGAADAVRGSTSMAETRRRLRHTANSSDSLAQDNSSRYVRLVRFSFLILIGRFATL
jgi:hypothetical protein